MDVKGAALYLVGRTWGYKLESSGEELQGFQSAAVQQGRC